MVRVRVAVGGATLIGEVKVGVGVRVNDAMLDGVRVIEVDVEIGVGDGVPIWVALRVAVAVEVSVGVNALVSASAN